MKWFFELGWKAKAVFYIAVISILLCQYKNGFFENDVSGMLTIETIAFIIFVFSAISYYWHKFKEQAKQRKLRNRPAEYTLKDNYENLRDFRYDACMAKELIKDSEIVAIQVVNSKIKEPEDELQISCGNVVRNDIANLRRIARNIKIKIIVMYVDSYKRILYYDKDRRVLLIPAELVGHESPCHDASTWASFAACEIYRMDHPNSLLEELERQRKNGLKISLPTIEEEFFGMRPIGK